MSLVELGLFRVKVTLSANETFETWRERDHDDLVLALALALYVGSIPPMYWAIPLTPADTVYCGNDKR